MVVVDSSALIPLAWVDRLDLITRLFEDVRTTEAVRSEVLVEGKRGTVALHTFLEHIRVHDTPPEVAEIATMEGIAKGDASVILVADEVGDTLLANDKGLIEVARTHGVECWWVTTVLLKAVNEGELTADEATGVLYDLVDEGMNLHPTVYARIHRKLDELGD